MTIGFRPGPVQRVPYHTTSGQRMGYILCRDGHEYVQTNDGPITARILRYKKHVRYADASACGGSFVYPDI